MQVVQAMLQNSGRDVSAGIEIRHHSQIVDRTVARQRAERCRRTRHHWRLIAGGVELGVELVKLMITIGGRRLVGQRLRGRCLGASGINERVVLTDREAWGDEDRDRECGAELWKAQ